MPAATEHSSAASVTRSEHTLLHNTERHIFYHSKLKRKPGLKKQGPLNERKSLLARDLPNLTLNTQRDFTRADFLYKSSRALRVVSPPASVSECLVPSSPAPHALAPGHPSAGGICCGTSGFKQWVHRFTCSNHSLTQRP